MQTKICNKCKGSISISDFHKNKNRKDGHDSICRYCVSNGLLLRQEEDEAFFKQGNKRCSKCKNIYSISNFNKSKNDKHGLHGWCKKCTHDVNVKRKQWEKPERVEYMRLYKRKGRELNREEDNAKQRQYQKSPKHKLFLKEYSTRINVRISHSLRYRIYHLLKRCGYKKEQKTMEFIGCSFSDFIVHLENLFKDGMTWENYGNTETSWSLDHVRPCASFDLSDLQQQKQCFHYTNLQPLWHKENLSKGARY